MSVDMDTVRRAYVDLQTVCSGYELGQEEQRITDLQSEIKKRCTQIDELDAIRDDALRAAEIVRDENPGLAFAFEQRAAILLEDIEKLRPVSLNRKLADAMQHQRDVKLIADILDKADLEFLSDD